jgi:predicted porin
MKAPWAVAATACSLAAAIPANAQSSVQLWGALDAGVTMVTNPKGGHSYTMDNGIATPNLWGLRGTEDLGGGNKAIFELIDQFNLGTGAIFPTNGGGLFSRNAYVGLSMISTGN